MACADVGNTVSERNESNNCLASVGTTRYITTDLPDLLMTSISNPPGVVAPEGTFSITDTVINAGGSGAGSFVVTYYFSTDPVKSPSDILLMGSRDIKALASRGSSTGTTTVVADIETGRYFLLACADQYEREGIGVIEANEDNNCLASATTVLVKGPDLTITAVSGVFGKVLVGRPFFVTDVVFNQSPAPAGFFRVFYYLSRDAGFPDTARIWIIGYGY